MSSPLPPAPQCVVSPRGELVEWAHLSRFTDTAMPDTATATARRPAYVVYTDNPKDPAALKLALNILRDIAKEAESI